MGRANMQKAHGWSRLKHFLHGHMFPSTHSRHGTTRPTRPNTFARAPTHDMTRPTRTKFGVSMCARPERNLGFPWVHDPNEGPRERRANGLHERAEGTRAVTT